MLTILLLLLTPSQSPYEYGTDWRKMRADRERQSARLGEDARAFLEAVPEATPALSALTVPAAKALVSCYNAGGLSGVHDLGSVLNAVAKYGDDAAVFLTQNAEQMRDPDACAMFATDALPYSLRLKSLQADASARRASRLGAALSADRPWYWWLNLGQLGEKHVIVMGVLIVLLLVFRTMIVDWLKSWRRP